MSLIKAEIVNIAIRMLNQRVRVPS